MFKGLWFTLLHSCVSIVMGIPSIVELIYKHMGTIVEEAYLLPHCRKLLGRELFAPLAFGGVVLS
jgi:hypothetical protein